MKIRISHDELALDLEKRTRETLKQTKRGILSSMHRGRGVLASRTPVDRGHMKSAWEVKPATSEIADEAPHAGIVEGGARPHKVNKEGREALVRWAMRQLGVDQQTAQAVAQGVINKLAKKGQKGKFIARDALPELRDMVVKEVEHRLRKIAKTRL